ncbi:energy transducer TonB [Fusobacterium nucleatum]|uniref:energy transducer TonB n=1 Tax=Fusobacterium nucleatum TaxID=851 RepID=UPI0030CAE6B6
MTDKNSRFFQGIVVALVIHLLIAILFNFFEFHSNNYSPKILEITLGESGGGGGSGKKSSSGEKAGNTSEASSSKTNKDNKDIVTDKIVKQKTIERKKKIEKKEIDTKKSSSSNNPVKNLDEQNLSNSTGETQGSTEQGDGEGQGSGSGEGSGSGSGTGSGKGEGNGDSTGNGSGNGAVTPPYLVSYTSPKYPPSVRNLEIEGNVYVKILVAADGKVKNVTLYKSSGNETLDSVAIKEVYQWRFRAAKDSYGNSMACNVILPVKFVLHD